MITIKLLLTMIILFIAIVVSYITFRKPDPQFVYWTLLSAFLWTVFWYLIHS